MKRLTMILGAAMLLMNIGCAQEKKGADAAPPIAVDCARTACGTVGGLPDAPGGSGSDGTGGFYSGSTVTLTNVQGLSDMFYNSYPSSNVSNIQVNIDMNRTLDAVIVSYVDGGRVVEAGLGTRFPDGTRTNSGYNGWVTEGSSRVYKGFFQDKYGAVVIVIDKVLNAGDGSAATTVGGSIWFQNFGDNPVYDSKCQSGDPYYGTCFAKQLMCWEIQAGPYDCRSFIVGGTSSKPGTVSMTSSPMPTTRGGTRTKSYVKLGDFTGLSRTAANLPSL